MTPHGSLGPFFAVESLDEVPTASSGWRPLWVDLTDATFVDAWVARAWERAVGGVEASSSDRRTLGAVLHLGVIARLASPWIGRFLIDGDTALPHLDHLWWRDEGTTMFPLAVVETHDVRPASATKADVRAACAVESSAAAMRDFARHLVERIVRPLEATTFTPSAAILRGNAASAINTAAGLVLRLGYVGPHHEEHARTVVQSCLELLEDGSPAASGEAVSRTFRRTSCCLAYALPGGSRNAVCGDCVLRT